MSVHADPRPITVGVLDDHVANIDGYEFRLAQDPGIQLVWRAEVGEELPRRLAEHPVDVLLLDLSVPTSHLNRSPYPILVVLPRLLDGYPGLNVVVITMHAESSLIKAVMRAGASGYLLKDDRASLTDLASVVRAVAQGGVRLSPQAELSWRAQASDGDGTLTARQLQALQLCAAFPNSTGRDLAQRLAISPSTLRNLLSSLYLRLGVRTRQAAVEEARRRGLLPG
jgi:DNA-binding NarL/FixJ family response regulator